METELSRKSKDLINFIQQSPTAYHAVAVTREILKAEGFKALSEAESWKLDPGGKYYIERNGSAMAAFVIGTGAPEEGFRIIGAHTDSPGLKLKDWEKPSGLPAVPMVKKSGSNRFPVEVYGGPILSSWLDRELSIAGIVQVRHEASGEFRSELFDLKHPAIVIPNPSIHFNRTVNKGFEYNPQIHLQGLTGSGNLGSLIASELGIKEDQIAASDLFLYDPQPATSCGVNGDLIVAGRIDNLAGCHAALTALLNVCSGGNTPGKTAAAFLFDNEEIGSRTFQGADSGFLKDTLDRITLVRGGAPEDTFRARAATSLISVDGAQAVHPNFPEFHDPDFAPVLNGGPVVKLNANYKYATTSEGVVFFQHLCRKADVPVQKFAMRSDLPCGSTIGTMASALGGIKTLDVGIPMLAMHSIRETAGILDQEFMIKALSLFFSEE